jgi:hypothetical protein
VFRQLDDLVDERCPGLRLVLAARPGSGSGDDIGSGLLDHRVTECETVSEPVSTRT